jgi:hypothetical protein
MLMPEQTCPRRRTQLASDCLFASKPIVESPQTIGSFQLQIDNYHFTDMGDVVSYVLLLQEPRRYPVQLFVYSQLMTYREKHDEAIHDLANYVANQKELARLMQKSSRSRSPRRLQTGARKWR